MALTLPIRTERLVLRRFRDEDRAGFLADRRHERLGFAFTGVEDGERIYRLAIAGTSTRGP